jgi:PAS domain S-box-containing protein
MYIALYMGTNLILSALPDKIFHNRRFYNLLVCFDTILIAVGIYLVGQVETAFFLIYFFIIGIASLSTNFRYLMINTAMFVLIYGWIMYTQGRFSGELATLYALRLPFIFVISLLFGYIIDTLIKDMNKDLEDSEEKFRSLVQSIEGYVFMLDRQGRLISVNRALARYLGQSENHLVGCIYTQVFPTPLAQSIAPYVEHVQDTKSWTQFEWHDTDTDRWYLISLHPVFDSSTRELSAVSVVAKDTTKRVQAEQELRDAYDKLQKTQEQLIQKSKLETMGRLSSGIAHQLRNPLEIILLGTEFVEDEIDKSNTGMTQSVQKIKQAVYRSNNIIEDFLRFSKSANFTLQPLPICSLINESRKMIDHKLSKQEVAFDLRCADEDLKVQANHGALQQVFLNLFTNAIEAQGEHGRIEVSIYREEDFPDSEPKEEDNSNKQAWVVVEVVDYGPGMDDKQLAKAFEPFYTTKHESRGTGLGLSIAKLILEHHQGKIEVQSQPGQGTTFKVSLQPA